MKTKRIFTKNFTETDMEDFGKFLEAESEKQDFIIKIYKSSNLESEEKIIYKTKSEEIVFTDFDILWAYNNESYEYLSLQAIKLLQISWINFVYNKQKTDEDKQAYKEAYHKYIDKTIFNIKQPELETRADGTKV